MQSVFIYIYFFITLIIVIRKICWNKNEWLLLLLIMSFFKTAIQYLFAATTVFDVLVIGGTQIHLDDIVLLGVIVAILLKCRWLPKHRMFGVVLLGGLPIMISLFRGMLGGNTGNMYFLSDVRKYLFFLFTMIAFYLTYYDKNGLCRINELKKIIDTAFNILIIGVYFVWLLDAFLGINTLPGQASGLLSDGGSTFRIIPAPQTLIIAFYTLLSIDNEFEQGKFLSLRSILLTMMIILLQWRTVVLAFTVSFVFLIVYRTCDAHLNTKSWWSKASLTIIGFCLVSSSGLIGGINEMITHLVESYANIQKGTGTFATRTSVWTMLLESLSGTNKLWGQPFGVGYSETVEWTRSAHSGYVDFIMKCGYIGLVLLIVLSVYLLIRSINRKILPAVVCLIAMLIYWIGYGFNVEQGAVLGFIAAYIDYNLYNIPINDFEEI